jgi:serine acetyltransferase
VIGACAVVAGHATVLDDVPSRALALGTPATTRDGARPP